MVNILNDFKRGGFVNEKEQDFLNRWQARYPEKFVPENEIFSSVKRGARIFIGTACGEPQYLTSILVRHVEQHPKSLTDTELMQVWTLGVAPWTDQKFDYNFRHNAFFIGDNTRAGVNEGFADYTPIFLSRIPALLKNRSIQIDVALVQVSPPDRNGFMSLGISVDITKAALQSAGSVIVQINSKMPRVHGDTFINIKDVKYAVVMEEELLEYAPVVPGHIAQQVGKYVAGIIKDGDTIQLGYGSLPNAILSNISNKSHLGIHTELLTDSMVELIKTGVIDNTRKSIDRGKTVASFCMGTKQTYEFINDNPSIDFREISYTNNPLVIAQIENMTAINAALQIDLTGQSTSESIGSSFFSGIGGHADFMRGANLSPGGKTILVLQSTARNGEVSRIVPFLDSGAGVTLNRGDINYVVTEYGVAYIHGKNIRERAMDLISIAHPRFRPWLIEEAKRLKLIYRDQAYIPGKRGEYPEHLQAYRETSTGIYLHMRPVKINDETLIKDLFYSLSDTSFQRRFMSTRRDMPHKRRQEFVVIDYTTELIILACINSNGREEAVGMGQILKDKDGGMGEVAFAVRDDYHNNGIGTALLRYLTELARREQMQGFTAEVLVENKPMIRVFEKMGFDMQKRVEDGVYEIVMRFGEKQNEK
jgi:acyl-CoA hydrolase/GNAT superfamily N-acetyltransferase